ncbi:MAG: RluA family pseudouridine synthase [Bacteroidota bacterium]
MTSIKRELISEDDREDLHVHHHIIVDKGQQPLRIDKFLTNRLEKVSRNRVQVAMNAGAVLVNEKVVKSNYKVRPQDEIKVVLARDPEDRHDVIPQDIPLDILYEDDDVLVLQKPSGMVVHPGVGNRDGTLVNALRYHFNQRKLPVLKGNDRDRPGLVHRLDKDTSGVMVIAKTDHAMTHLAKQFFYHTIERKYRAIVWGGWESASGTIDAHIGRHPTERLLQHVYADGDDGKHAITHYKVLRDFYYVSLIECQLETGRTHQIRVHMNYMNHPVFNDQRYGGDSIRKGTVYAKYKQFVHNCFQVCPRQALHAQSLRFVHPSTGEEMYFETDLPPDMDALLAKWENYFDNKISKEGT